MKGIVKFINSLNYIVSMKVVANFLNGDYPFCPLTISCSRNRHFAARVGRRRPVGAAYRGGGGCQLVH